MWKAVFTAICGGAAVFASAIPLSGESNAADTAMTADAYACYKVARKSGSGSDNPWYSEGWRRERDEQERLNLNIKFHSYLYGDRQPVYDVQGKHITAEYSKRRGLDIDMETADGTLITNGSQNDHFDRGARLGLETHGVLRGANNITFDCTTSENEVTPDMWRCRIREDGEKRSTPAVLQKVGDRLCDVFRDSRHGY